MPETTPPPIPQADLGSPVPSEPQHSEGGFLPAEQAMKRIERLKIVIQGKKPYRVLDAAAYESRANGSKPLAQIALEGEASKISTHRKTDSLDDVNYACSQTPERIVRVRSGVEGAPVRGNSAHGVMFLELGTQRGEYINAAVKIYTTPSHAFLEYANTLAIRNRGIETLEPLAVIIDQGEGSSKKNEDPEVNGPVGFYLSTMEPIRSLDRLRVLRLGYTALLTGEAREREYLGYLRRIGTILAQMHLRGVFPKDSQIKNFAIRENGTIIPIDFENTEIYDPNLHLTNPEKFVDSASKGLWILFKSLHGLTKPPIDFFEGYSGEPLWEAFNDAVFTGYRETYEDEVLSLVENRKSISQEQFVSCLNNIYEIANKVRDQVIHSNLTAAHQ